MAPAIQQGHQANTDMFESTNPAQSVHSEFQLIQNGSYKHCESLWGHCTLWIAIITCLTIQSGINHNPDKRQDKLHRVRQMKMKHRKSLIDPAGRFPSWYSAQQ